MNFYRELSRIEHQGLVLCYSTQSNPFEYELLAGSTRTHFSLLFSLPSGSYLADFSSLTELSRLALDLDFEIVAFAASNPMAFARMASSLDQEIGSPLDPPSEWDKVLALYQASPADVTAEEWDLYHAAQRAFKTSYWPPSVDEDTLSWVATKVGGGLIGVRLKLSTMRVDKETLHRDTPDNFA